MAVAILPLVAREVFILRSANLRCGKGGGGAVVTMRQGSFLPDKSSISVIAHTTNEYCQDTPLAPHVLRSCPSSRLGTL